MKYGEPTVNKLLHIKDYSNSPSTWVKDDKTPQIANLIDVTMVLM